MYSPSPPPLSEPKIAGEYAFWNFQAPKALKRVFPPAPRQAKIAWKYAFWNFQAPKTLKRVLPPAPPPLRAQNVYSRLPVSQSPKLPGSTHFESAQNTFYFCRTCTAPPLSKPKIAWEYAFWNFQAPKTLKRVLPPAPSPSQSPKLPGSTHFGTFKRPKH